MSANIFPRLANPFGWAFSYFSIHCKIVTQRKPTGIFSFWYCLLAKGPKQDMEKNIPALLCVSLFHWMKAKNFHLFFIATTASFVFPLFRDKQDCVFISWVIGHPLLYWISFFVFEKHLLTFWPTSLARNFLFKRTFRVVTSLCFVCIYFSSCSHSTAGKGTPIWPTFVTNTYIFAVENHISVDLLAN